MERKSAAAVSVVVMEVVSCCFKSSLSLAAKRVERVVTLLDAWNACEKGSDRAMMMVAVKEADLMVV